jgi:hypothetical protein
MKKFVGTMRIVISLAFFLSFVTSFINLRPVSAQSTTCIPTDWIILLDQSEDMLQQDPKALRVEVTRWLLQVLGSDRLYRCAEQINYSHRMAVVSFGGPSSERQVYVRRDLDLVPINPSYANLDNWYVQRAQWLEQIKTANWGQRDLGAALAEAKKLLSNGSSGRRQIVVLFTGGAGTSRLSETAEAPAQRVAKLHQDLAVFNPTFQSDIGPYLYVFAFQTHSTILMKRPRLFGMRL